MTDEDLAREHLIGYLEKSYPEPRPTQGGIAGRHALPRAAAMIVAVHDEGPDEVAAILDPLDRDQLYAMAVTLAAMIDPDVELGEALGWVADLGYASELEAARNAHRAKAAA